MTDLYRYKAFISYSHSDERWAKWLHRRLEAFRLPSAAARSGRLTKQPLRPIFRDRDELSSSSNLTDALLDALRESESLIVICSRHAAASKWVNAEIEKFIELGRGDRVFALIVDETADQPVFPAALTVGEEEPLAADVNRDGKRNALLKTVAGVLSVRFDEIRQRHEQNRQRKMLAITLASVAGVMLTTTLAIFALISRQEAEQARVAAENSKETAQEVTGFLVGILEKANPTNRSPDDISIREVLDNGYDMADTSLHDKPEVRAEVLGAISGAYDTLGFYSRNAEIRADILEALQQSATTPPREVGRAMVNYAASLSGMDTAETNRQAEVRYLEAVAFLETFPEPNFYLLGTAHIGLGTLYQYWRPSRVEEAFAALDRAITYLDQMPEPDYVKLSWTHQNLGTAQVDIGDLENARQSFTRAESLASEHVADDLILLSTIRMNLGSLLILLREPEAATKKVANARASFIEVLGGTHARVAGATRLLGTAAQQSGDFDLAERFYREALRVSEGVDGGSREELIGRITAYLGDLATARNRPDEADKLYRRALDGMGLDIDAFDPRAELLANGVVRYPD